MLAAIARFVDITEQIHPDKVQLNTLDRPGTVKGLKASDAQNTMRFIHALETVVPVEAVGPFRYRSKKLRKKIKLGEIDTRIIELISRRPATLPDIQLALGIAIEEVKTHLEQMLKSGHISFERLPRGDFYRVAN